MGCVSKLGFYLFSDVFSDYKTFFFYGVSLGNALHSLISEIRFFEILKSIG